MNKEKPKKEADKYARDNLDETNKFLGSLSVDQVNIKENLLYDIFFST